MNCVSSNRSSNPIIWTGVLITCDQSADAGHSKNLQNHRPLVQARKFPLPFNEDDARLMPQKAEQSSLHCSCDGIAISLSLPPLRSENRIPAEIGNGLPLARGGNYGLQKSLSDRPVICYSHLFPLPVIIPSHFIFIFYFDFSSI